MLERLVQYNEKQKLFKSDEKIIIALSGGVDSMVLADLMLRLGRPCVFAHCNFHLRGEDSDRDERHVRDYAEQKGVVVYVKHFDTETYAATQGISIEMAARELRYEWFEELRQKLAYDKIAVAHHADDQIETFFINLLRGSGINGLKGMRPINGRLIRPLLWASRAQIEDYACLNGLRWCEDATNSESMFLRNKIRNELLPVFDRLFPEGRKSIGRSVNYLASENGLYREMLQKRLAEAIRYQSDLQKIEKKHFRGENGFQLLFEWLHPYGFNTDQIGFIFDALDGISGKKFLSNSHRLVVERISLQLMPVTEEEWSETLIQSDMPEIVFPVHVRFLKFEKGDDFVLDRSPNVALLDFDKLNFPLKIRKWHFGDRFRPLGMKGSKLLSDFFVDQGFTLFQKKQTFVLLDAHETVVWVVGQRIDDRFKLKPTTNIVFKCRLIG